MEKPEQKVISRLHDGGEASLPPLTFVSTNDLCTACRLRIDGCKFPKSCGGSNYRALRCIMASTVGRTISTKGSGIIRGVIVTPNRDTQHVAAARHAHILAGLCTVLLQFLLFRGAGRIGMVEVESLLSSVWLDVVMAIVCIVCAAVAAGLTIGLVSLNQNELILLSINGTEEEKLYARRVLPLLEDYHTLIVSLFLFNAVANEALPIFISGFVHKYYAILIATLLVLLFGEILPSSIFSGPSQLKIASTLLPVTVVLLCIFYPVAKPIGLILDCCLGAHTHKQAPFDAKDLYTLLSLSEQTTTAPTNRVSLFASQRSDSRDSDTISYNGNRNMFDTSSPSLLTSLLPAQSANQHKPFPLPQQLLHLPGHDGSFDSRAAPAILRDNSPTPPPPTPIRGGTLINATSPTTTSVTMSLPTFTPVESSHNRKHRHFLDHDSVLIAQGAILCGRKHLGAIVQPSFVETNAAAQVNLQWFEQLGRTGYSRVLVRQRKLDKSDEDINIDHIQNGDNLLGYIVLKELLSDLHTYLCLPLQPQDFDRDTVRYTTYLPSVGESIPDQKWEPQQHEPKADQDGPMIVKHLPIHPIEYFSPSQTVLHALNVMQSGISRIGALTLDGTQHSTVLGFFTLEDVLEEVIQEEIQDEKDVTGQYDEQNLTLAQVQWRATVQDQLVESGGDDTTESVYEMEGFESCNFVDSGVPQSKSTI